MNIILHYPSNEAGRNRLASRVATIHAEAAIGYIQKLTCPKEQKMGLLTAVISDKKQQQAAKQGERVICCDR